MHGTRFLTVVAAAALLVATTLGGLGSGGPLSAQGGAALTGTVTSRRKARWKASWSRPGAVARIST